MTVTRSEVKVDRT